MPSNHVAIKLFFASHFCTTYFAGRHVEKYEQTNAQSVMRRRLHTFVVHICELHTFAYLWIKNMGKHIMLLVCEEVKSACFCDAFLWITYFAGRHVEKYRQTYAQSVRRWSLHTFVVQLQLTNENTNTNTVCSYNYKYLVC